MADNIFTPEQQQQLAELMNGLYGITRETDPLIRAKIEEKKASDNAKEALKQLGKQLGNTAIDYSKAVLSAGEGFGKFGGTVTGATNAIGDWASKLGVAGVVVGGFIKIFGEIAAKSLKQNDDLMKSYQNLSDMGSVAAGGFETLRDQLHSVGLMAEEAEKFERVLRPITHQMTLFGGSVTKDREQLTGIISGLIGPGNQLELYLGRLGYSTQDIREGTADFVQRQAKLGLAQGKSQKQLIDESFKYMVTLKELQELTGLSRDEAQKELDMQLNDARLAVYVSKLHGEERENLLASLVAIKKDFGSEWAGAMTDLVVNLGKPTTELSAQMSRIAPNAYNELMKTLNGDANSRAQMLEYFTKNIQTDVKRFSTTMNVSADSARELGLSQQAIIGSLGRVPGSAAKTAEQLEELANIGKNGSKRVNQNLENEQRMRAMRIAGDKALYEVGDLTVGLFTKLNEVMFAFGKSTAKVVDWMNSFLGKKTNYSELFRDLEDNLKDINAQQDVKDKLLKDIELTKSLIASVEKDKAGLTDKIKSKEEEVSKLTKLYQDELKTGTDLNKRKELGEQVAESHRQLRELRSLKNLDNEKLILDRKNKLTKLEEELAQKEKKLLELDKERRKLDPSYNPEAADRFNLLEKLKQSGIVDPKAQANILAQIQAESGGKPKTESLKYTPEQLMNTFPGKFKDIDEARTIASKGEEAVGNRVYGGRMGNAPEEGFKYRGRGLIQLTGKENYEKYGKILGVDLVNNPDLANDPDLAQQIAVAYFKEKQKAGVNLSDSKQVSKAVGHVDIGNQESNKRAESAQSILEKLPKAATGGMFAGSTSGYPVMLHGNESVWPNQDLQKMLRQVQQTSLSQYKDELMGVLGLKSKNLDLANENIIQNMPDMKGIVDALKQELPKLTQTSAPTTSTADNIVAEVMSVLSEKLDALIEEHRKTNDIQDQILTYTKA